jgi:hypothetical protein
MSVKDSRTTAAPASPLTLPQRILLNHLRDRGPQPLRRLNRNTVRALEHRGLVELQLPHVSSKLREVLVSLRPIPHQQEGLL